MIWPIGNKARFSASIIVNAHREGRLLQTTLNNCFDCRSLAEKEGHSFELIVVGDKVDAETRTVIEANRTHIQQLEYVEYGDVGRARQLAILKARADIVFVHDGDDLYSRNYYVLGLLQAAAPDFRQDVFYHCEYRIDFEREISVTRNIASEDPAFDPQSLVASWYFSFKGMAHRSLFKQLPIPHFRPQDGIGGEDWSWGCDLITQGGAHRLLADTIVFYRRKRPAKSLGMVSGVVHGKCKLFDPAYVNESTAARANSSRNKDLLGLMASGSDLPLGNISPVPGWIVAELQALVFTEPLLSDVIEKINRPADPIMMNAPAMPPGVPRAYRDICQQIDSREKVFLFVSPDEMAGGDWLAQKALVDLAKDGQKQVVLFYSSKSLVVDDNAIFRETGAVVINVDKLRNFYRIPNFRLNRFLIRFFIQLDPKNVIDFGSAVLREIIREFPKIFRSLRCRITSLLPNDGHGLFDSSVENVRLYAAMLPAEVRSRHVVLTRAGELLELIKASGVKAVAIPEEQLRELSLLLKQRNSWDAETLSRKIASFSIQNILSSNEALADQPSGMVSRNEPGKLTVTIGGACLPVFESFSSADFVLISTPKTRVSAAAALEAIALLKKDYKASFAVPQFFLISRKEHVDFLELKQSEIVDRLAGLADDHILGGGVPLAFFSRRGYRSETLIGRSSASGSMPFYQMHSLLLREAMQGKVRVINGALAVGAEVLKG